MRVIFLCREVSKETGEVTVRSLADVPDTSAESLLFTMGERQRMNPELQYFAMDKKKYLANKDTVKELLGAEELPDRSTMLKHSIVHV